MIDPEANAPWPERLPPEVETLVLETVEMIHELDDTSPREMTPLFYQHGYEQVRLSLQNLLRLLGHDPDA
ncbi:MAG: hypothetical protein M3017_09820 [Actinomycetota bacterium]|nr:hypothetical protein [Actinomycetota bacterium]